MGKGKKSKKALGPKATGAASPESGGTCGICLAPIDRLHVSEYGDDGCPHEFHSACLEGMRALEIVMPCERCPIEFPAGTTAGDRKHDEAARR